ncbi:hypothetical protein N665_2148s0001 [Sinapis alba]|nr:hypothetical protein N665_2148s0001 [Sinapis alba]
MMNKDNIVHTCDTCKKEFPSPKSLYGHQRVHTREKQLERQLKKTRPSYYPGQGTSTSVDFGGYSLPNDKYLSFSRDPNESISAKNTTTFPSLNGGVTSYGFSSGTPLVTHNHLGGVSFGPFKSGGGGSSRDYPYSSFNRGVTMTPPATPYRPLTQDTTYGSSSRVPLPSYRYNNSHAFSLDHSLGSANSIGSFNRNNNNSSQGPLSLELSLGPSKSMGNGNNNSNSQGSLSLALSLGPPKSMGGGNNNSSAYPSFNGGVTGGGNMNMNMSRLVRPRASRFHFQSHNPLDSITRNVPLFHPPPPTTNMNRLVRPRVSRFHFHGHNPLDSILRNAPLSHPPPDTNLPDDKNVSGSSLAAKEKDEIVVLDDDEKDNVVINGDHDENQQEEVEAKSD